MYYLFHITQPPYVSKYNSDRENQVILSMITDNNKKFHYLSLTKLLALFRRITSKYDGDFYYLNCLHFFRIKYNLKENENICKDHDYCCVEMSNENNKKLNYNPGEKCMRVPFIICADLESLLEEISTCHNNPNESSTTKINKHKAYGYSLFTHCSFNATKNKRDCYRGQDCMKNFCKHLKEHTMKIINCEKKKK